MRRMIASMAVAASLTLLSVASALGHVHGITPLRCVAPENAGANQTDSTPAALDNGGPIFGLIPRDVGNAPLTVGDGGRSTPACPET
jgi:hypothetical protein